MRLRLRVRGRVRARARVGVKKVWEWVTDRVEGWGGG